MSIPKILIIGETFRSNGGGGITMMNLFKDWPSDKLAVITELTHECSPAYHCYKYCQIGHLEKKIPFPLGLFKRKIFSGEFKWMRLKRAEILNLILRWIYQTPILVPVNIPR